MPRLSARFHRAVSAADVDARAAALALEQSIEMPLAAVTDARVRRDIVATVEHIRELATGRFEVVLGIARVTVGNDIGQLMPMLFGNCSLQNDVELVDVELPDNFVAAFGGPRFGLPGLRRRLGADRRALTMTALKPQGLPSRPRRHVR